MFTIEKGVPLPNPPRRKRKYPFDDMEIGDSFFVEGIAAKSLSAIAYTYGKKTNKKFIAREVEGGARCWRLK